MEYLKYKIYKENNETANDFGGLPLNFQIAPPPAGLNFLKSNQWNTQHLQNTTPGCATSSTPLVVTRLVPVRSASRTPALFDEGAAHPRRCGRWSWAESPGIQRGWEISMWKILGNQRIFHCYVWFWGGSPNNSYCQFVSCLWGQPAIQMGSSWEFLARFHG